MKFEMIKQAGGMLVPADDYAADKLTKFKTNGQYTVEIKQSRNPNFHRKVFAFFGFCFQHWSGGHEFQDESLQFDQFRKELIKLAGFYDSYYSIGSEVRMEAKSLAFGAMGQDEFESCYHALIQAAMSNIFKSADEQTLNKLMSFF